jgi:hypothetical protein
MMKHFPTALMSAAWLLFAASPSRQFATALTRDQENKAEHILLAMEDEVKAFRFEMERVYRIRCNELTHSSCKWSNYDDCSSAFPSQQCSFHKPQCENYPTRCDGEGGCDRDFGELMMPDSVPEVITPAPDCNGECWQCCAVAHYHVIICC